MDRKDLSNTSRTDWEASAAMDDEGINYSDIPALTEEFFENAILRIPASQAQQLVRIESDVLQWFQAQGSEYKSLIHSILRLYIDSHSNHPAV